MEQSGIAKSKLVYPSDDKIRSTEIGSSEAFEELLRLSQTDPEAFWGRVAKELTWYEPWKETMTGSLPGFRFF